MLRTGEILQKAENDALNQQLIRRIPNDGTVSMVEKEWLVSNGLGGYASGTISGVATRRYHGFLIAAHPAPLGRIVLFSHIGEQFICRSSHQFALGMVERNQQHLQLEQLKILEEFRLEWGLPIWRYRVDDHIVEKRVFMPHGQNTVHVSYRLVHGTEPIQLRLRGSVHFRGHDEHVSTANPEPYILTASQRMFELNDRGRRFPTLRLMLSGESPAFMLEEAVLPDVLYRVEAARGYDNVGRMWSPGYFQATLTPDKEVVITASTESWERVQALEPVESLAVELERRRRLIEAADRCSRSGLPAELTLAADQFIISPASRIEDYARAEAAGEQARTIIAGYHWFTDWGRDSMISLEGLTLVTGRHAEAGYILRTFINHMRDGLIPNFFPDRSTEGVYHTADATMWYFHALSRYIIKTGDLGFLRSHYGALNEILECHQRGTRFGIRVDPEDGLLHQGAEGYQLTWMDAKVDGWVVTPRRGKAVEINALWYNALRLMEQWASELGEDSRRWKDAADFAQTSFNSRFWNERERCLYDVVDAEGGGNDPACRPNQIFSVSLPNPILAQNRWEAVVTSVQDRLLTPFGLRSLAPGHPDYKPQYHGDLRSRDAAYHQGTVWAWLIGPFIDAWLRVYPDRLEECHHLIRAFETHLNEACIGTISEVFDAEAPYHAGGCAAQAWSVAEVLRISSLLSEKAGRK